eukprot:2831661-Rhodomonas_salina.4
MSFIVIDIAPHARDQDHSVSPGCMVLPVASTKSGGMVLPGDGKTRLLKRQSSRVSLLFAYAHFCTDTRVRWYPCYYQHASTRATTCNTPLLPSLVPARVYCTTTAGVRPRFRGGCPPPKEKNSEFEPPCVTAGARPYAMSGTDLDYRRTDV